MLHKNKLEVDVIGLFSGVGSAAIHSQSFAQAMNKIATVSRSAGMITSNKNLLYRCLLILRRRIRKRPSQLGIVISGLPYPEQISARWIVWETTIFPKYILEECKTTDYLWAPSSWGYTNLMANGIEPSRIAIVPEGVDTKFFKPSTKKNSSRFRFLFVGKWETRKFVDQLVKAFADEFNSNENVELVLHANNIYIQGFSQKEKLEELNISNSANIILSEIKSKAELRTLYQSANCFVMPTRAEGWGLPILESMACGVPAIVTAYSAPLDFVTNENGYLLNVDRMIDARCEMFNVKTGQWAEPDTSHLKHLMRHSYENPKELVQKGINAAETARKFSWDNSAKIAYGIIESILADH